MKPTFNGNVTDNTTFFNPWKEEVPIIGSDSMTNPADTTIAYVSDLFRGATAKYVGEIEIAGYKARRYRIPTDFYQKKSINPKNDKFHQDRWSGNINLTSVKEAPIIITKPYFLDFDPEAPTPVVNNINGSECIPNPETDEIQIDNEFYSGTEMAAALNI
jgi:hypothetical protein